MNRHIQRKIRGKHFTYQSASGYGAASSKQYICNESYKQAIRNIRQKKYLNSDEVCALKALSV